MSFITGEGKVHLIDGSRELKTLFLIHAIFSSLNLSPKILNFYSQQLSPSSHLNGLFMTSTLNIPKIYSLSTTFFLSLDRILSLHLQGLRTLESSLTPICNPS